MIWVAAIAVAYLVGSIPFGFLIARARGVDIRRVGSGNVGATNVGRVLGRSFGLVCFFLDAAKGAAPVVGAGLLTGLWGRSLTGDAGVPPPGTLEIWGWLGVAGSTLIGHMFPPWLGFRGGKGVATGFGAMLAMWPVLTIPAAVALVVWLVTVWLGRFVSVASMTAVLSLPLSCLVFDRLTRSNADGGLSGASLAPIVATAALAALVIFRHRGNLARLRAGTEPRMGRIGFRGRRGLRDR